MDAAASRPPPSSMSLPPHPAVGQLPAVSPSISHACALARPNHLAQQPTHPTEVRVSYSNESRLSKNEKREAAREKARILREEQKKKDKRTRLLLQGGIIVAALAIIAVVAIVIVNNIR